MSVKCLRFVLKKVVNFQWATSLGNLRVERYFKAIMSVINADVALFSELGSSPATMEAGKAVDAYGSQPGHVTQQNDGVPSIYSSINGRDGNLGGTSS